MEKHISHKWRGKKTGVVVLISDKIDSQTKATVRDKERHCIMIKGTIQQEDTTLINIYIPNKGAPKYGKQILTDIKGERDNNTTIEGDFSTPLTSMDISFRKKFNNKKTVALNDTLYQMDLIDIFRAFHPSNRIYILFKCTWNIF